VTSPLISAAFAASIATYFAPEQDYPGLAIAAIDATLHEVLVKAYALAS
jgi:hypothetical protein